MNAPANIDRFERLAAQIVTGDFSGLPRVDHPYYSDAEWTVAAQAALDCGDYEELRFMVAHAVAYDDFRRKGEKFDDQWAGFGNWFQAIGNDVIHVPASSGMTLRDHYAGLAMSGLLAGNAMYGGQTDARDKLAIDAFAHADAMIAARKGSEQ